MTLIAGASASLVAHEQDGAGAVIFAPGEISTPDYELNASFTPDGKTLYFSKSSPSGNYGVIVLSHLRNGHWTAPEVAPFSGQYTDWDPAVAPDGKRIFWVSNRPVGGGAAPKKDFDIWYAEQEAGGWGPAHSLGAPVNTADNEWYPSIARNGTLYFSACHPKSTTSCDIYRSRLVNGAYADPERLSDSVNSRFAELDVFVDPDERYLIFVSNGRPEGLGAGDLYVSYNRDGQWTQAVNLGPKVNSAARDYCPSVSPDGKYLYFSSNRGIDQEVPLPAKLTYREIMARLHGLYNGFDNIYRIPTASLGLPQ